MANVLVTGTSTGIGFSISKILASAGHRVYATMRNSDRSPELKKLVKVNLSLFMLLQWM